MLTWTEKYETGHPVIDAQHRLLFAYTNHLEELTQLTNPTSEEVRLLFETIDFFETYASKHFQEEEGCMHRLRCPAHQDNILAHREFLDFHRRARRRIETEGFRPNLMKKLHDYCATWIQHHILHIDTQIKSCLQPKG